MSSPIGFNLPQVKIIMTEVSSVCSYDSVMKAKLSSFLRDEGTTDTMDDDGSIETSTTTELAVPDFLPEKCLDHVILACSNLMDGMEQFEEMTGLTPKKIGSLRGVGTKSARVALDNNTFVEIIGPDPNNQSVGIGPKLLGIPKRNLVPYHYVVRAKPENVEFPEDLGWDKDSVVMVHADAHEFSNTGYVSKWDLVFIYGHGIGGCVPEFVNWRENQCHPTARLPRPEGKIAFVRVQAPDGHYVHQLLRKYRNVNVYPGSPELVFSLDTPRGNVQFRCANPEGIVMPGFGDENHPTYTGKNM